MQIAMRAMDVGRRELYDVVILDTAGRLAIDETLMERRRSSSPPTRTIRCWSWTP